MNGLLLLTLALCAVALSGCAGIGPVMFSY
jgi:hypothetical protein